MLNPRLFFAVVALSAAAIFPAAASSVDIYLSAPFTQMATQSGAPNTNSMFAPGYTNAVTETFESETAGNTYSTFTSTALNNATFSTTTGTFVINGNNQYGGGLQGNYLGVSSTGTTTLQLSAPVGYLGLEWCAVDAGNSIALYDQNNALIGTFNALTFTNLLGSGSMVTAINGNTYNTADYKGQPTGTSTTSPRGNDSSEYFAFVNFVAGSGTLISKVVISQTGGAVFESDNYAILATTPSAPLGSFVRVTSVPEPSTWGTFGLAVGGLLVFTIRRRRS